MKNILCLFMILLIVAACKKGNLDAEPTPFKTNVVNNEPTIDTAKIYGSWKLISYSGGFAGGNHIPTDETVVDFYKDKTVKYYKNSFLITQDTYNIQHGKSIFTNNLTLQIITTQNLLRKTILTVKTDTLKLADEAYDLYSYIYLRR